MAFLFEALVCSVCFLSLLSPQHIHEEGVSPKRSPRLPGSRGQCLPTVVEFLENKYSLNFQTKKKKKKT